MLRPGFAIDAALRELVTKARLAESVALLEIDAASATTADWDRVCGGAQGPDGSICLGAVLAPGQDDAAAALTALLPEALREGAVFSLTTKTVPELGNWCWQRMTRLLGAALGAQAASQLASAALRNHTKSLEQSLALAEAAFADFRKEPLRLGFQQEPSFVYAEPPADEGGAYRLELHQEVAAALGNVTYLDLFFAQAGSATLHGEGRLVVTTAYGGTLVCDHNFALSDVVQGWNRFICIPEVTRRKQPLHVALTLTAPHPVDTKPGLGAPHPDPALCARIEGGGAASRPLALRAWCGIAGLYYPRQIGILGPAPVREAAGAVEILSLPAELIAGAALCQTGRDAPDFNALSFEAETQSLLVHPLGRTPTVARLERVKVEGLTGLAALAQLRHFEAQPTEFALYAQPAGPAARFDGSTPLTWLHLQAGEWGDVRCTLAEPLSGMVDIYLLTRNLTEDHHLSWAFFRGLQLACRA